KFKNGPYDTKNRRYISYNEDVFHPFETMTRDKVYPPTSVYCADATDCSTCCDPH
ncbi:unnamed protein product, partial [Heterotrigona itama]